jgi:hypothetical protein
MSDMLHIDEKTQTQAERAVRHQRIRNDCQDLIPQMAQLIMSIWPRLSFFVRTIDRAKASILI